MISDDIQHELTKEISYISGRTTVEMTDRLYHDLRLRGGDVHELLEYVRKRFGVEFSEVPFGDYFPDESVSLFTLLRMAVVGRERLFKSITVEQFVRNVQSGQWNDVNSSNSIHD